MVEATCAPARLLARIEEAQLRAKQDDKGWDELLARIAQAKDKP